MFDYEQIEDSLRFCGRKLYSYDTKDCNEYSDSEKESWKKIAADVIEENKAARGNMSGGEDISYSQVADVYRKRAEEYVSIPRRVLNNIIMLAACILIAYGLASFVLNNVAFQSTVEGSSMVPTLENSNSIIVDRMSYIIGSPKRYDIVVFPVKNDDSQSYFIKRIIALPGETVYIDDGKVYINGVLLKSEKYGKEMIMDAGLAGEPQTLASDEYFVLGDNRNMSTDSRSEIVGFVKRKDIIGKAVFRIWPFNEFGGLN